MTVDQAENKDFVSSDWIDIAAYCMHRPMQGEYAAGDVRHAKGKLLCAAEGACCEALTGKGLVKWYISIKTMDTISYWT